MSNKPTICINSVTIEFNGKLEIRNNRIFADGIDITPEGIPISDSFGPTVTDRANMQFISGVGQVVMNSGELMIDVSQPSINIEVNGNVDKLSVDLCSCISVKENVNSITSTYGSITCGDISGDVDAKYGSVKCKTISGDVKTKFGKIVYSK